MKRLLALLLAIYMCLGLAACGKTADEAAITDYDPAAVTPEPGLRYTDFTGALLGGGELTLSDYEGKVILLNFWATWCGPCVGEMPAFPQLLEKYGDDLAVITVDKQEDSETVAEFIADEGYDFPVVLDTDGAIGELYPSYGIPYTIIIAPDGTISDTSLGAGSAEEMVTEYSAMIDAALG